MEMDRLIDPEGSALWSNGFHMQCTHVKVAAAFALPCTQSRNLAPLSIYHKVGIETLAGVSAALFLGEFPNCHQHRDPKGAWYQSSHDLQISYHSTGYRSFF